MERYDRMLAYAQSKGRQPALLRYAATDQTMFQGIKVIIAMHNGNFFGMSFISI